MVGGWKLRKLYTHTTLSGKQRWIWKMPLACRALSLSDWPSPVGKVSTTSLKQCGNGITWTFAEEHIDRAQLPPKQLSASYLHRDGWKKKTSHRAPSNTFQRKTRSGWGPSSAINICVRSQLHCLPSTVKSNVVLRNTLIDKPWITRQGNPYFIQLCPLPLSQPQYPGWQDSNYAAMVFYHDLPKDLYVNPKNQTKLKVFSCTSQFPTLLDEYFHSFELPARSKKELNELLSSLATICS